jgi:hypothetical protein
MERTPSPVHIPVVPTGDDNTRLAVDEAGVVIGDRIGPSSSPRMAPLRAPRRYRCIRRITTAQGRWSWLRRSAASHRRYGRDSRYRAPLEFFGVEDLAARPPLAVSTRRGWLLNRARSAGWSLVALDLGVDTSTPAGQAMVNVMATFGQLERRVIGQSTRDALAAKRAAGVRLRRPSTLPTPSHLYSPCSAIRPSDEPAAGSRSCTVVGAGLSSVTSVQALPPAPRPSTAPSRCWCTTQSADTRSAGTFGGLDRVLQIVNGAQYRVEVVAVTAVPPSTVTCVAYADDAPATPPRHPPARGGAVSPWWNGGGIEKGLTAAAGDLAR